MTVFQVHKALRPALPAVNAVRDLHVFLSACNVLGLRLCVIGLAVQIIGGENWNEIMYAAVGSTSWFAAIYFVVSNNVWHCGLRTPPY